VRIPDTQPAHPQRNSCPYFYRTQVRRETLRALQWASGDGFRMPMLSTPGPVELPLLQRSLPMFS
jgi:hypothetical protein